MKDWKIIIPHALVAVVVVSQIILSFFLYNPAGYWAVRNLGWVVLWTSAIFGWLPIYTFKRRGGVPRGKSFVHTTTLVDSGIYSICRHPQFLAGILLGLALILIVQHWIITALGLAVMAMFYIGILEAEGSGIEKFGNDYRHYMKRVPRTNFLVGLIRLLIKRRGS